MDPISFDVMTDPVSTADGQTYDRQYISDWFEVRRKERLPLTSPLTGLKLPNDELIPSEKHIKLLDELRNDFDGVGGDGQGTSESPNIMVHSDIFVQLDRLVQDGMLAKLMNGGLRTPQIVVIGVESHGKSTLLERLIGFAIFPKSARGVAKMCTRCPIRVHLRRSVEGKISSVCVIDRITSRRVRGSIEYAPLDRINLVVHQKMNMLMAEHPRKFLLSDKEIVVNVTQPYCPNLDILDLPGIVAARALTRDDFDGDLFQQSTDLIKTIIESDKKFSIFLLVSF